MRASNQVRTEPLEAQHDVLLTVLAHGDWMGRTAIRLALQERMVVGDEALSGWLRVAEQSGAVESRLLVRPHHWQWRRRVEAHSDGPRP